MAIESFRKHAATEEQEFRALAKTLTKLGDHTTARIMKQEAKRCVRQVRAATIILSTWCNTITRQNSLPIETWPVEMAEEFDQIGRIIQLNY